MDVRLINVDVYQEMIARRQSKSRNRVRHTDSMRMWSRRRINAPTARMTERQRDKGTEGDKIINGPETTEQRVERQENACVYRAMYVTGNGM